MTEAGGWKDIKQTPLTWEEVYIHTRLSPSSLSHIPGTTNDCGGSE